MLKNKYVAIILVIVAIALVINSIRILTKSEKPQIKTLKGPDVDINMKHTQPKPSPPTSSNNMMVSSSPIVGEKMNNTNIPPHRGNSFGERISFDKRLMEIKREILEPEELVWGNDPFGNNSKDELVIGEKKTVQFTNVFLSAIINKKDIKMCIINNIVFKEGEKKNGIYVSKIGDQSVMILTEGREFNINIFEKKTIPVSNKSMENGDLK